MCVTKLTDEALQAALLNLRIKERAFTVDVLDHLAELDKRELYLEAGHSSLFSYCTERLGYSRPGIFRTSGDAKLDAAKSTALISTGNLQTNLRGGEELVGRFMPGPGDSRPKSARLAPGVERNMHYVSRPGPRNHGINED